MWGTLAVGNTCRFSSKEIEPKSGIYYYGYRYYEPNLQRWLNRDPIQERGGLNLYGLVGNAPVNAVDPSGLFGSDPEALNPSGGSEVNGVPAMTISCGGGKPTTVANNDSPKEVGVAMMVAGGADILGVMAIIEKYLGGDENITTEEKVAEEENTLSEDDSVLGHIFRDEGQVSVKCQSSLLTLMVTGDRIVGCRGNYASNIRERSIIPLRFEATEDGCDEPG